MHCTSSSRVLSGLLYANRKLKEIATLILQAWLDLIFPPLCKICKEICTTTLFCPECWQQCSLPDLAGRCSHCFEEMEEEGCLLCDQQSSQLFCSAFVFESTPPALHLCSLRKEDPEILAAFALVQWEKLGWPVPNIVIPLPEAKGVAQAFASRLDCVFSDALFYANRQWNCRDFLLEPDAFILLIAIENSLDDIRKIAEELNEAFPKKIFVLSLIPLKVPHDSTFCVDSSFEFLGNSALHGGSYCATAASVDSATSWQI